VIADENAGKYLHSINDGSGIIKAKSCLLTFGSSLDTPDVLCPHDAHIKNLVLVGQSIGVGKFGLAAIGVSRLTRPLLLASLLMKKCLFQHHDSN